MVQLKASVTIEKDSDPSMDDEWVKVLMNEIQKEMDAEILRKSLVESGWVQLEFHYKNREQAVDIQDWCEKNIKEFQWMRCGSYYVFRKKQYLEWFMLRWL